MTIRLRLEISAALALSLPLAAQETTDPGTADEEDLLTSWEFWWSHNSDRFAAPRAESRRRGTSITPTVSQIEGVIVPALHRAMQGAEQRDLVSCCLMALGKAGRDAPGIDVIAVIRARLTSSDQETRETAALALGLTRQPRAQDDLVALATDRAEGRLLCGRDSVDLRTRCFAIYGLGLLAGGNPDRAFARRALDVFVPLITARWIVAPDLRVAAIHATSLLDVSGRDPEALALFDDALTALRDCGARDVSSDGVVAKAHVATAIARLWQGHAPRTSEECTAQLDAQRREWLALLRANSMRAGHLPLLVQSAILALGATSRLLSADPSLVERIEAELIEFAGGDADLQARCFARLALGEHGGMRGREFLLEDARRNRRSGASPWTHLGLGVHAHLRASDPHHLVAVDSAIQDLLVDRLHDSLSGGVSAIALGLIGADGLSDRARTKLLERPHPYYWREALGMLGDHEAILVLRESLTTQGAQRPDLRESALALAQLGDDQVTAKIVALLPEAEHQDFRVLASASMALAILGDARAIPRLVELLDDTRFDDLSHAFVAVALGGIADPRLSPWNSALARGTNYRAALATLTDWDSGILGRF